MTDEWTELMRSQEYYLLREIDAQLRRWGSLERPLKASEMQTTVSTDKLATIMAWAQVALREEVRHQNLAPEMRNVTPVTHVITDQTTMDRDNAKSDS